MGLMMRYCPDNIGRDTISSDANLYDAYIVKLILRATPLHYLLGQGTYHASCNYFYELEGIFYLLSPFLLDNYYSQYTRIIFACVYVCIIIQAKFRPYLYGRTNMVHNSVFYAWLGNLH